MVSMVLAYLFLLLFLQLFSSEGALRNSVPRADPWDIDGPCQVYVEVSFDGSMSKGAHPCNEKFAVVQSNMVRCATNWSIPPKVCTNCWEQFIALKQVEYETKHLDNVTSLDNRTCSQVIYEDYLLSYSYDISEALSSNIWEKSRCHSCLTITWNFTANDSRVEFSNQTLVFQEKLFLWRECVVNYTRHIADRNNSICGYCKKYFDDVFSYYWDIYVEPNVEFCVDIETTMNDTFHLWNDVWACAEKKDRKRDTAMVLITMAVLFIITALFYASNYIQGGGQTRIFVRYSRMIPGAQRSRLLSSSTSDHDLSVSAYSVTNSM